MVTELYNLMMKDRKASKKEERASRTDGRREGGEQTTRARVW
jgi:hypothetical protein